MPLLAGSTESLVEVWDLSPKSQATNNPSVNTSINKVSLTGYSSNGAIFEPFRDLSSHPQISSLVWLGDESKLAIAGLADSLRIFKPSGELIKKISNLSLKSVSGVLYDSFEKGGLIVSDSSGNRVQRCNLLKDTHASILYRSNSPLYSLACNDTSSSLASSGDKSSELIYFNRKINRKSVIVSKTRERITSLAINSSLNSVLVAGYADGLIQVFDNTVGKSLPSHQLIKIHTAPITGSKFSLNHIKSVYSVGMDGYICHSDIKSKKSEFFAKCDSGLSAIEMDNSYGLYTGDIYGKICLFDIRNSKKSVWDRHIGLGNKITSLALSYGNLQNPFSTKSPQNYKSPRESNIFEPKNSSNLSSASPIISLKNHNSAGSVNILTTEAISESVINSSISRDSFKSLYEEFTTSFPTPRKYNQKFSPTPKSSTKSSGYKKKITPMSTPANSLGINSPFPESGNPNSMKNSSLLDFITPVKKKQKLIYSEDNIPDFELSSTKSELSTSKFGLIKRDSIPKLNLKPSASRNLSSKLRKINVNDKSSSTNSKSNEKEQKPLLEHTSLQNTVSIHSNNNPKMPRRKSRLISPPTSDNPNESDILNSTHILSEASQLNVSDSLNIARDINSLSNNLHQSSNRLKSQSEDTLNFFKTTNGTHKPSKRNANRIFSLENKNSISSQKLKSQGNMKTSIGRRISDRVLFFNSIATKPKPSSITAKKKSPLLVKETFANADIKTILDNDSRPANPEKNKAESQVEVEIKPNQTSKTTSVLEEPLNKNGSALQVQKGMPFNTSNVIGPSASGFSRDLIKSTIEGSLGEFVTKVHSDIQAIHLDVLKQSYMIQNEISQMKKIVDGKDNLVKEVLQLKNENKHLRKYLPRDVLQSFDRGKLS